MLAGLRGLSVDIGKEWAGWELLVKVGHHLKLAVSVLFVFHRLQGQRLTGRGLQLNAARAGQKRLHLRLTGRRDLPDVLEELIDGTGLLQFHCCFLVQIKVHAPLRHNAGNTLYVLLVALDESDYFIQRQRRLGSGWEGLSRLRIWGMCRQRRDEDRAEADGNSKLPEQGVLLHCTVRDASAPMTNRSPDSRSGDLHAWHGPRVTGAIGKRVSVRKK